MRVWVEGRGEFEAESEQRKSFHFFFMIMEAIGKYLHT